jgi:redox-sensitive bicupin YhaK (pirin superfamily)
MKTLAFIYRNETRFSVGDFSPVLSVFSHYELGNTVSPFLLLDHLGPGNLKAGSLQQGVSEHPHRGFETVTIMFEGELEHRDSSGGGGVIQAGDVQWMTAASGIMHKESFSSEFAKTGGRFEMLQLWVNLPAKDKMNPPRYQSLSNASIPKIELENNAGFVRVIAGEYQGKMGPAKTHTPMKVFDVFIKKGQSIELPASSGETTLLYMRTGQAQFEPHDEMDELWDDHGLAVMSNLQENVKFTAQYDSHVLYLSAAPFHEPINGHGPFVMNTYEEILAAFDDIKTGNFIRTQAIEHDQSTE